MIVSHEHRFIFIKTKKTAGTSIEIALSKFCGPRDIITRITPEDQVTRRRLGYRGPQNYAKPLRDHTLSDFREMLRKPRLKARFYNHMSAREARPFLGEEVWRDYFKFCVERNPWDRVISHYYWQGGGQPTMSLEDFVHSDEPLKLKRHGIDLYTIDGELVVDKVCRFETLAEDLEAVRLHLGLPEKLELPRAKSQFRTDKRSYRELLGPAERRRIAELFSDEIRLMGYEF